MKSPIYWHPKIYSVVVRFIYGKYYKQRYRVVAKEIGNLRVLDLCCGNYSIYDYLKSKESYKGLDNNPSFVAHARKRGIQVIQKDVVDDDIPSRDCVMIIGSLYQFYPHHEELVDKMLKAAKKKVIISEHMMHLHKRGGLMRLLSRYATDPGGNPSIYKFNKKTIVEIFKKYNVTKIIDNGPDIIGIFDVG